MSSIYYGQLTVSLFGQSHAPGIGVTVDGLPAGEAVDLEELQRFLQRRAPGRDATSTPRKEGDVPKILCGLVDGVTCGAPLAAVIENTNTRSKDYDELRDKPRPGHADYTAYVKWRDQADMRGGGHFSGRLTAPLCIAGGIARQILSRRGVYVGAHLWSVGTEQDAPFPLLPTKELFETVAAKPFPVLDDQAGERMQSLILEARQNLDSVGGVIECAAVGLPAGLGDPMFGGVENRLASALFGIPAVKGVEFGDGFAAARAHGSENNDPFIMEGGRVAAETNHAGGILGGITSGMPLVLRTAMKPTPSIALPQQTVRLSDGAPVTLELRGRHDPCIVPRAAIVQTCAAALAVGDLLTARYGARWMTDPTGYRKED